MTPTICEMCFNPLAGNEVNTRDTKVGSFAAPDGLSHAEFAARICRSCYEQMMPELVAGALGPPIGKVRSRNPRKQRGGRRSTGRGAVSNAEKKKMRKIDVRDFGAIGDQARDDSGAIRSAIDVGAPDGIAFISGERAVVEGNSLYDCDSDGIRVEPVNQP